MTLPIQLVSFDLCPYVQRATIVLKEKAIAFERVDIDLAAKPDWFLAISPLGKVPLLKIGDDVLFESSVIVEYLDEIFDPKLHPSAPLTKARHRGWMEFGSSILADIWVVETTSDRQAFDAKLKVLREKFERIETALEDGSFFAGSNFCIVDAVFAPVFRYFDVFDAIADLGLFRELPKVTLWRAALARRPSVISAVRDDYPELLRAFLRKHNGIMAQLG